MATKNTIPAEAPQDNAGVEAANTPKTAAPKVSDALTKIGQALLKSNPDMAVVYMTADGQGFYAENDAENHARALTNKAVSAVKRK